MVLDTNLTSEELLSLLETSAGDLGDDELSRLTELYHFADFGRLSVGLFHDLATPLNIVLLNLEELKEKTSVGKNQTRLDYHKIAELQTAIDRAFDGTQRMIRFLQLARAHLQRKTVLRMFSLNQEVEQVMETFRQNSNHQDISLQFKNPKQLRFFGSSTEFFQVILNLVANAKDSYVEIAGQKDIFISLNSTPTEILLSVTDHGKGISADNQAHIFEPFFSTKAANKGTGIGLFISREIIEKHFRGSISFTSEMGQGSTFTVHLPRKRELSS